jgi:hypothetical protein
MTIPRGIRFGVGLLLAVLLCGSLPAGAAAAPTPPSVSLTASFTPEELGRGTTLGFGFFITAPAGRVPPPLTDLEIRYPADIGLAVSGLGVATCTAAILEALGPSGCPADSRLGFGLALAEIPIGPEIVKELGEISIVRAPTENGHFSMLIYARGESPVDARIVFPGMLLPAASPFGGRIHLAIPLVPSLPEAPDVAVVEVISTFGPQHLTYYERVNGKLVAYNPQGILLPDRCPRGGFPFAATFTFLDGSKATARTAVPCPHPRNSRNRATSRH